MKTTNSRSRLILLPAAILLAGSPAIVTTLPAQEVEGAIADAKAAATKAMLKDLDDQIDRIDEFIDHAPTPKDKAAAKARLEKLKERRSELRKNYVQARYDGLKADVQTEYNKLSLWAKKTFSPSSEAKLERKIEDLKDDAVEAKGKVRAAANPAAVAASADLAAYKANPSAENKTDMKASMDLLDAEIERLDDRCDNLPKGAERDATKARIKALKSRRSELASDFRKARFDALMDDVKAEWRKLTN